MAGNRPGVHTGVHPHDSEFSVRDVLPPYWAPDSKSEFVRGRPPKSAVLGRRYDGPL